MDEIGDMTPLMQTKVLRVLQDQQFERVGGNETIQTDVRLIAATNRDLESMIARRDFRSDLFYRLNVYSITLPPLREREDDIRQLADHFCRIFSKELSKQITHLSSEAIQLLTNYSWPGNVRELQSVIKHAILEATGPVLVPAFLPDTIRAPVLLNNGDRKMRNSAAVADSQTDETLLPAAGHEDGTTDWDATVSNLLLSGSELIYEESLHLMERNVICRVLRHTQGNQLQAARLLGVSRATLRVKCRTLGITIETIVADG